MMPEFYVCTAEKFFSTDSNEQMLPLRQKFGVFPSSKVIKDCRLTEHNEKNPTKSHLEVRKVI